MAGLLPASSPSGRRPSFGSWASRRKSRPPRPGPQPGKAGWFQGALPGSASRSWRGRWNPAPGSNAFFEEGQDVATAARTPQEAAQLNALLNKKYRYFDYKWDLVFWVTALPVVAAAADITKLLFAGDWDFWTDWKDRQWWMTITPFAMIIIPPALPYIQWLSWKFPTGFTYTAVGLWLVAWLGRWLQRDVFVDYPPNLVWPPPIGSAALFTDRTVLENRGFVLASLFGGPAFTFGF